MSYRSHDIDVRGGELRVGEWASGGEAAPVVLAVHGITASHRSWLALAEALPEVRIIAPDLRGRGRSAALPGPFGMAQHAEDLIAVLDRLDIERATLVGHSMGGFASLVTAHLAPERFDEVLLVDGGLPLAMPAGLSEEEQLEAVLGPAAARLAMTFPDAGSYREFWMRHPAFQSEWSPAVEDYVDYDLVGWEPELHPSASYEAVAEDSRELGGGASVLAALAGLRHPVTLLTAPRGLLDQSPGLYSGPEIARWREQLPTVTISEVPDVNHYTIVMSERGAAAVASEVRRIAKKGA